MNVSHTCVERSADIRTNYARLADVTLQYLTCGKPADRGRETVVLLHGVPQSSHAWRGIIPALADRWNVVAPDLRGLGDSSRPSGGYDKRTVASDVWELLHGHLGLDRFFLVGHDWGGPVAFTIAAEHRQAVRALVILDVTIPGDGAEMSQGGRRWHHPFFRTLDLPEALCAGREHLLLDWLFDTYGHRQNVISELDRAEYHRVYAKTGAFRAMISYYRAFPTDAADNEETLRRDGKLTIPVLALGGDSGFGRGTETIESLRRMAENVSGGIIPQCGHWVAEEAPDFLIGQLCSFFARAAEPVAGSVP